MENKYNIGYLEVIEHFSTQLEILIQKYVEDENKDGASVELITCKEAAKLYPIGAHTFRDLCNNRYAKFPCMHIGSKTLIIKNKLDEWFTENAVGKRF